MNVKRNKNDRLMVYLWSCARILQSFFEVVGTKNDEVGAVVWGGG